MKCDFSGWATRNDLKCSDGRTIRKDAFKDNDGKTVPLVWNHQHNDANNVLGHALLKNRENGVYAYCTFNDTEQGRNAKELVVHGDISALSIYANKLKQVGGDVLHGQIRELSLVLAGANPGAFIDSVMVHGEDSEDGDAAVIFTGEAIELYHSDDKKDDEKEKTMSAEETKNTSEEGKTVQEVFDSLTEEQKNVVYALVGEALDGQEEGDEEVKHNIFDDEEFYTGQDAVLSHADQESILDFAKSNQCGSLQAAIGAFVSDNDTLAHNFEDIEALFPEFKNLDNGIPDTISRDQGWVTAVLNKVHKSPISRIKMRQLDARNAELRAKGYKKGDKKAAQGNIKLITRSTDPQTVYVSDSLNRDDIIDITDFDVVSYQYGNMRQNLNEELATAILFGDGREDGDEHKIHEEHIHSVLNDDELFTIHTDVDIEGAKKELQGTNTGANFSENYIYAEAIVRSSLYAREKYKGSGTPDFFCTPHLLNVMLLSRDMNGRRIYDSKADLAKALNVNEIYTVEQMEGKTRKDEKANETKDVLGIFVNLADYQIGSAKGGEITKFEDFDIDFNRYKYLMETRLSGAPIKPWYAIVLEQSKKSATPSQG